MYGKEREPTTDPAGVFIVAEAIAPTQALANSLTSKARVAMIVSAKIPRLSCSRYHKKPWLIFNGKHAPYPSQKATAGNVGYGIGGVMEIETGPCAEFSLYHLMALDPGEEHLHINDENTTIDFERQLIRSCTQIIGSGSPRSPKLTPILMEGCIDKPPSLKKDNMTATLTPYKGTNRGPAMFADLCRVFRSKNAGPYEITIDAIFYSEADYQRIKGSGMLSRERVAHSIGIPPEDIIWMGFFDPARAFKVTFPRVRSGRHKSAGGFMEHDVHGSQEHTGLAMLKLSSGKTRIPIFKIWFGGAEQRQWWKMFIASVAGVGLLLLAWQSARRRRRNAQ
jgi:hypothetical protein